MPHTYLQDLEKIVDTVSRDEGLILEEKLILLGMMNDYLGTATKRLEDELATCKDGLVQ